MHDVSPELALVDGALAERERDRLPEPEDCLALRPDAAPTVEPSPALTVLAPPPTPEPAELEPEAPPPPQAESESPVQGHLSPATLALAEQPADPAPAPVEVVPVEVVPVGPQTALAEPDTTVEPEPVAPGTEADVVEPETEPEDAEVEEVPEEPAPAVPVRMPEWVASDVPPQSRRRRRKDRAQARRSARRERPRRIPRRVAVAASWVVLCGFLASPLLAFIPSPNGERPTLASDGTQSVPDVGENAGNTLSWDPVPKAAGYSVVFVNNGVRSDRWSQSARLRIPAGTESEQLVTYEWFVYPAFRDGAGYRYGPLVASGEVTMPTLAPTESS